LFTLFDEHGQWLNGIEAPKEKVSAYFEHRQQFRDTHPCPVKLISHCSNDYTMFILSVGQSYQARRGDLQSIYPESLKINSIDEQMLEDFIQKYNITTTGQGAGWWLTSWWG